MGLKVFQGEAKDVNLRTATQDGKVLIDSKNAKQPFKLPEKPAPGEQPSNLPSQAADKAAVFINEDQGRDVIVQWDGTVNTKAQGSASRTTPVTVGTPSPGEWLVTPDAVNVENALLDGAFQATVPQGWQPGASVKFTTSLCGLDSYIVTYRFTLGGKQQLQHVVVTARKRLKCHLFEMKSTSNPKDPSTLDDYRSALAQTQSFYADNFGIDLVFPAAAPFTPEDTTLFAGARSKNQLYNMIPAAHSPSRPPRDLWYNIVASIQGGEVGWGGSSLVSVDVNKMRKDLQAHEDWLTSWKQYQNSKRNEIVLPEHWVGGFHPPLQGAEKDLALALANGTISPRDFIQKRMFLTILHETGHALGLVPSNEEAGGIHQMGWKDTAHALHCEKNSCAMYWEADEAQLGFGLRMGEDTPFDHPMLFFKLENCTLYLRACDLKDIRHFVL